MLSMESVSFIKQCSIFWYVISGDGIMVDPANIEAVLKWSVPITVTEVRSFIGLASYYRRLVEGFSSIAGPMTKLLRKIRSLSGLGNAKQVLGN